MLLHVAETVARTGSHCPHRAIGWHVLCALHLAGSSLAVCDLLDAPRKRAPPTPVPPAAVEGESARAVALTQSERSKIDAREGIRFGLYRDCRLPARAPLPRNQSASFFGPRTRFAEREPWIVYRLLSTQPCRTGKSRYTTALRGPLPAYRIGWSRRMRANRSESATNVLPVCTTPFATRLPCAIRYREVKTGKNHGEQYRSMEAGTRRKDMARRTNRFSSSRVLRENPS